MLISILMNCHNGESYLREAIDSIYAQTFPDWEIIFFDNASTDRSAEIAQSYDHRLKYFKNPTLVPLGKARNLALAHAEGDYIAFLDTDDLWLPTKLERQIQYLAWHPKAEFIYSNYYRMVMPETKKLVTAFKRTQPQGIVFERMLKAYPVNLQTVLLKKDAYMNLGLAFDESLEMAEEFDFFLRIFYHGVRAFYIKEPLIVYRIHSRMSSLGLLEKSPLECKHIYSKFLSFDPELESKYPQGSKYFLAKIDYLVAKAAIQKEDYLLARNKLWPHKFIDLKFFLLCLMSFLPAEVWKRIHDLKIKGKI